MEITLLAFAGSSDAFGFTNRTITATPEETPLSIVQRLAPGMNMKHIRVALDCEFVTWDTPIGHAHELAFIPPVSGG